MYKLFNLLIVLLALTFIHGCSTELGRLFTVYKIDIQQGNAVEPEKVRQLEIGMTKSQVEYLLGTPLITDLFHPDRWDYIYYLIPDYGERQRRHVAVFFEAGTVSRIEEEDIPPIEVASQEESAETTEEDAELKEEEKPEVSEDDERVETIAEELEEAQKEEGL